MNDVVSYVMDGEIAVVTVNNPPVNALSQAVRQGLLDAIRRSADDGSRAVLILCEGRTFIAGADITEFGKPMAEPYLPDLLNEIEASEKLVVAAIHGTALGGGFETALASHYRIAVDSAKVGLPEVKLGLLPGAGGTQRAPRIAGVAASLELILSGAPIPAAKAGQFGLVDKVVPGDLGAAAREYVRELLDAGTPVRRTSEQAVEAVGDDVFDTAAASVAKRARGQTAPHRIIECVRTAMTTPFAEGQKRERELFMESMQDPQSKALQHVFFAEREAAKVVGIDKDTPLRDINSMGVIGGGTMGGGIAMSFANAGIPVTLIEINDEALERGLAIIDSNYAGSVKRGKLSEDKAADCRGRITGATDYAALADVDLVIEAVFEDPELKKEIFAKLDAACKPGAILATNTSYQDVNAIAAATGRPEDVLGMHFFSPAHIMKLLEVVRGDETADDALATVMKLSKKIRKVAVVSGVCYGFIGNRMLQGYFREAQLCLVEGGSPESVDKAMFDWGMAMGPISVADLAGLDVGYKARQALPADERGDPAAYRVPDVLVEMGRLGQKSGKGFYNYDPETRRPSPDPEVQAVIEREAAALGIERREIDAQEVVDRLIFALANEGFRILEEGIAQRPGDIDIVYLYGYGFPAWRGGPMHYVESVGLDKALARIEEFRERFGDENWAPAPLLEKLVAEGRSLKDWADRK
ncbi:MAG: 3-hydroxyacyl-CoA dehydrogenase NAD-binding domain-containing protein [Woeseiaceae bacterium]|nr:3-hydroxyacyl-CoA dehydrogenase NAD-binding domain-containing protein [Woeseiaceae bacterium]